MGRIFSFLKNKPQSILVILIFCIASVLGYFLFEEIYRAYVNKEIAKTQQQIKEIEEEIERAKKFDEEKYAERVSKFLDFDAYFSTSTDIELEGVEIIPKGDRKLVINHTEGYQIEIPNDLILNRSREPDNLNFDNLKLIKKDVPLRYWWMMRISVYRKGRDKVYDDFLHDTLESIKGITYEGGIAQENRYFNIRTKSEEFYIDGKQFYKVVYWAKEICDPKKIGEFNIEFCDPTAQEFINEIGYFYIGTNTLYKIYIRSPIFEEYVKTFKFLK